MASFQRVLRRIKIPGMAPVSEDVLFCLGKSCAMEESRVGGELVSPQILVDLLFDEGSVAVSKFGFTSEVSAVCLSELVSYARD